MRSILCCVLSLAAFAHEKGSITGKISDTIGLPVSGASIQARNAATGSVYKATSAATGEYRIEGLSDGTL